ncbi:hypothetical protein M408DRAFT_26374 [Serendipita vermifera MAFF 305830]|uniref:Uncharacterized protein n=1 Tax=Serendipita vermifera MAFF 305830 TaxID=933852 RepID=A0A0C2WFI3_SERVB|nr:hypothetical protein M408DRAFT_26374 [Serendipita vermifera MAFF 305830]
MIFSKVLFAVLASSVIFAAPIPSENPSSTLEKRGPPPKEILAVPLGAFLNGFPVPPPMPAPPQPAPAPLPGPPRPIPTRRHTT